MTPTRFLDGLTGIGVLLLTGISVWDLMYLWEKNSQLAFWSDGAIFSMILLGLFVTASNTKNVHTFLYIMGTIGSLAGLALFYYMKFTGNLY